MSQLLVLGSIILAADPVETGDSFVTPDQIFPKHVIPGYFLVGAVLPEGFTPHTYFWNGSDPEMSPVPDTPVDVPQTVNPRQIRQALTALGLRNAVETAVSTAGQDMQDWWGFTPSFDRYHPEVLAMASTLGVTSAQVDALFIRAGSL